MHAELLGLRRAQVGNLLYREYDWAIRQSSINKYCHLTSRQTKIISQTEVAVSDHLRIITHIDMKFSLMLLFGIQHSTSQAVSSFDASNAHLILKNKAPWSIEASGNTNLATQSNFSEYFIPLSPMYTRHICFPLTELFQTSFDDLLLQQLM